MFLVLRGCLVLWRVCVMLCFGGYFGFLFSRSMSLVHWHTYRIPTYIHLTLAPGIGNSAYVSGFEPWQSLEALSIVLG